MGKGTFWTAAECDHEGEVPLRFRPQLSRVTRGVYVAAGTRQDHALRARAMLEVCPDDAVLSHQSAARWWGGVVPDSAEVHVSQVAASRRRRSGLVMHRRREEPELRVVAGIRVTTPRQTFLDLATSLGLVDLLVLGDSLVAKGLVEAAELRGWLAATSGRGAVLARKAAAYVRGGVDSPMESRLRLLLVLAGYPEPEVNRIFRGDTGDWVYRLDLCWPDWRLAIEYDGRQHAESIPQWQKDIRRREDFANWGWRIMTATGADVYRDPAGFLDRLDTAIRERGGRPPLRRRGWELHFPGR